MGSYIMKYTLQTFYKSKEWTNLLEVLKLERVNSKGELICEYCGEPITKKYDCIGHHDTELTAANVNDLEVSLNPDNIKLIHFRCHNKIHQRFDGFKQEVYLVYGSPCSGKSTWVRSVANEDDLILDMDSIWESICLSDKYSKPNRLKANAFGIRDCILDQIKTRTGMWRNAYVIGTYPLKSDRDRLCSLLRAKSIFIQEDKETCLKRAKNDEWEGFIEEYFENFVE